MQKIFVTVVFFFLGHFLQFFFILYFLVPVLLWINNKPLFDLSEYGMHKVDRIVFRYKP